MLGVPNEDGAKVREWIRGRCHQTISADSSESGNSLNRCLQATRHSAQIEFLRGVDSSSTLRTLLQRRLVRISGRAELPGRPTLIRHQDFWRFSVYSL